jgi:hypothetical protein
VRHSLDGHRRRIPDRVISTRLVQVLVFECAYWHIADTPCSAVRCFLVPSLHPGQVVILDTLSAHKCAQAREAIEAAGASFASCPLLPRLQPD